MADIQRCRHYAGSSTPCAVGLVPQSFRDDDGRLPCVVMRGVTGAHPCDLREMPPAPADTAPGSMSIALAALTAGRCPSCGDTMTGEYEHDDGRVYAMPCKHVIRSKVRT